MARSVAWRKLHIAEEVLDRAVHIHTTLHSEQQASGAPRSWLV